MAPTIVESSGGEEMVIGSGNVTESMPRVRGARKGQDGGPASCVSLITKAHLDGSLTIDE